MKKIAVLAVILVCFVVAGCETKYYSVLITNDSSKDVSFTYNDSPDTLAPDTSKTYEVLAYTQPPKDINVPGALSVKMIQKGGDTFTFINVEPIKLNVFNKLPIEVKIKADNYIEDDDGLTELVIAANDEKTDAQIYTLTPNFTSSTNYPVIIDWNYKDDAINVILR